MPIRIILQNDVVALRDVVERELGDLDSAVASCGPKLDAATGAAWQQAKASSLAWVATVDAAVASIWPGAWGLLYEDGITIESSLRLGWWPRLTALGCQVPFAQPTAPPEPGLSTAAPDSPFTTFEGMLKALIAIMVWREVKDFFR